jgi:hypothetical protein
MTRTFFMFLLGCSGALLEMSGEAQDRTSVAGESAAQALKTAAQAEAEQYNLHLGPVGYQVGAALRLGYTDNAFYSDTNRLNDFVINPEVTLAAFAQVSEINTVRISVGLGYEYYTKNSVLNADAPMINPDSELAFNLFVGDFHFRFHERFQYLQTLFINTSPSGQDILFNFNNVGIFTRWDNMAGVDLDWDLDRVIVSASYNHENFESSTESFKYLNRASEWFTASAAYLIGDNARVGVESAAGVHDYDTEVTLNDHWQVRAGPFVDLKLQEKINFRAGGGYDTAQYDSAGENSNFETYYAYGQISQTTRYFTHSLSAGRETLLGDNANNVLTTYVRYSISSPMIRNVDIGISGSVHFDKEYGGAFTENYTYYVAGLRVGYQIHKYWRTNLGYEFLLKESDLPGRDYYRNRVILGVSFAF